MNLFAGPIARLYQGLIYGVLALPAFVVVGASLSSGRSLEFPPRDLTLQWYAEALTDPSFRGALVLSTELAGIATILAIAIGGPAAFALARREFAGRQIALALLLSPLVVPAIVLAIGLLQVLTWLGVGQTLLALVIGHVVVTLPYVVRTLIATFVLFDPTYEEAARSLRATTWQLVRRVMIPMVLPGLLSAAIFAFVTSFGNLTVSIFLAGGGRVTLPVQIFTYVEQSTDPIVAAASTIVIGITALIIVAIERTVGLQRIF